MKISELKVGDWVAVDICEVGLVPIKVQRIDKGDIIYYSDDEAVHVNQVFPIEIDKASLLYNNFEKSETIDNIKKIKYYRGHITLVLNDNCYYVYFRGTHIASIKYIHQLQHILWALNLEDNKEWKII